MSMGREWKQSAAGHVSWVYFAGEFPLPVQGWKVHVTATVERAAQLIQRLGPKLNNNPFAFKLPADLRSVIFLNSGLGGPTQVGKVVTVYVGTLSEAIGLVKDIAEVWADPGAPVVPSDLQYLANEAVSLRFGAFGSGPKTVTAIGVHHNIISSPDGGMFEDVRRTGGGEPPWGPEVGSEFTQSISRSPA